jgi:DNA adenine methylase
MEDRIARPFLKWAGGKTQLLNELISRMPEKFGIYHEPFLGSGALFFQLRAEGRIAEARLSDVNPELINAWTVLRDDPGSVISELRAVEERISEDDYYAVRATDPADLNESERAARMIYLNRLCFNGLYRVNRKGSFNVPFGRYKNPRILDSENLLAVSRALQGVEIRLESFESAMARAEPDDFVYLDPPYDPLSPSSSFTSYSSGGFGEREQKQLAAEFANLSNRGVHALLSNSDTPLVQALYFGYDVNVVGAKRSINCVGGKRGTVREVIVRARPRCSHSKCMPKFSADDERAATGMDAAEVRRRWPRFEGCCPDCGEQLVMYASASHYIAGDW